MTNKIAKEYQGVRERLRGYQAGKTPHDPSPHRTTERTLERGCLVTSDRDVLIVELARRGWSHREIGDHLGIGKSTVGDVLRRRDREISEMVWRNLHLPILRRQLAGLSVPEVYASFPEAPSSFEWYIERGYLELDEDGRFHDYDAESGEPS